MQDNNSKIVVNPLITPPVNVKKGIIPAGKSDRKILDRSQTQMVGKFNSNKPFERGYD